MASRLEQQSAAAAAVAATRGTAAGLLNRSELTTKSTSRSFTTAHSGMSRVSSTRISQTECLLVFRNLFTLQLRHYNL